MHATGLRSDAKVSSPNRAASNGICPEPLKGICEAGLPAEPHHAELLYEFR
jgi:hypothetical protein